MGGIFAELVPERFVEILRRLDEPGNEVQKTTRAAYHLTIAKGGPMMAGGVTAAIMLAKGLKTKMLAHLDHEGLATAMIAERVKDGGKIIKVVRFRITDASRSAIEG
jgi:hypothetical protein